MIFSKNWGNLGEKLGEKTPDTSWGLRVNALNGDGWSPLHLAAAAPCAERTLRVWVAQFGSREMDGMPANVMVGGNSTW